ncbi:MAG: hypothetical protein ACSHX5_03485 [Phycisphaerales bacterium]
MSTSPLQSSLHPSGSHAGTRTARTGGLMVAAIAVHLLVATMASAATTCGETIERTRVTRLSHCVAQAIRELVDQSEESRVLPVLERFDVPMTEGLLADADGIGSCELLGSWLLDLPPPMK